MKATSFFAAFVFAALSISIVGCTPNTPDEPENPITTDKDLDDEVSNCEVSIKPEDGVSPDYFMIENITIKNAKGKVKGGGKNWGTYFVPYDGTITIGFQYRYYSYDTHVNSYWASDSCTVEVGSAHALDVSIYKNGVQVKFYVGGVQLATFTHPYYNN